MRTGLCFAIGLILFTGFAASSQRLVYSVPDKDDTRRLNFEIVGKISGNFVIYKSIRNRNVIAVLDNEMKQIKSVEHDYLPTNNRGTNVGFLAFPDFAYMFFQYRKKNTVHCAVTKIDGNGERIGDILELDTSHVNVSSSDDKVYSAVISEDKSKIMVFKINSRNKKKYELSTLLMDDKLNEIKKSRRLPIILDDPDDYLNEFHVDNDGDLIFTKFDRVNNENVGSASLIIKYAGADTLSFMELDTKNKYLDEIRIKPDNINKRYIITSLFYKEKRGNVDGFFFYIWDKTTARPALEDTIVFSEELRREAKGNATVRTAFNDYFIRNIIVRKDGGFIIVGEAYYTSSRGGSWNRWYNLYGSPYMRSYDYYYYSPYSYNNLWANRGNTGLSVRYQADNIAIMAFDKNGDPQWSSIITKEQFDDQSDDLLSYQMVITGGQAHFLFNNLEKKANLLNDFSVQPDGKISRNPTLKNLDRGYELMPKFAKQVSSRQVIIPCIHRNYICFAKLEYN